MISFSANSVLRGIAIGMAGPPVGFYLYKLSFFNYFTISAFFSHLLASGLLAPVISLCLIINAALFFYFIHKDKDYTARGILLATFMYGVVIMCLKFF